MDLDVALLGNQPGALKVLEAETPEGWYVAYSVPGKFSKPDMVEFLVERDGVTNRSWEGDKPGPLVLYRSIAGAHLADLLALLLAAAVACLFCPFTFWACACASVCDHAACRT